MSGVELVDETFISAAPSLAAAAVADTTRWPVWFPDLELSVFMDRGLEGIRWSVTGAFVGSMEVWLESFSDGVIVHYYLRVDPVAPGSTTKPAPLPDDVSGWRAAGKLREARATAWKHIVWALKDELEGPRRPGAPATT